MCLRRKLEDDPYSLTQDELKALQNNDRLDTQLKSLLKDAFIRKGLLQARGLYVWAYKPFNLLEHRLSEPL